MIKIGEYNTLEILRDTDPGLFLGDQEGNDVLLPNKYVPENFEIGEKLTVFVYLDHEERLVATTLKPYIKPGEFALLRCNFTNKFGAFLDWNLEKDLDFVLVKNLDGAVHSLTHGESDYFLWEKFTTKPLVDDNIFRRIGECPTPWPCFVIAAREAFITEYPDALQTILEIINNTTPEFKFIPSIDRMIANRYEQKLEDVQEWLSLTEWSTENISEETINKVQHELKSLEIIPEIVEYEKLVIN